MMTATLSNGVEMPMLGLGVYDMYGDTARDAVGNALRLGYRLIDTATTYLNEREVGEAVRASGLPREEVFVTTKLRKEDNGYDQTLRAFEESIGRLGLGYADLYLVHWPVSRRRRETWRAMERLYGEGRCRAIGVANHDVPLLDQMNGFAHIAPMVNQVEFSPFLYQHTLLERCRRDGILMQAYSPLARGKKMGDPRIRSVAAKHGRTTGQVILRWDIQHGLCPIPKSADPGRQAENLDVFGFSLDEADMSLMDSCDEGFRICDDPMRFFETED